MNNSYLFQLFIVTLDDVINKSVDGHIFVIKSQFNNKLNISLKQSLNKLNLSIKYINEYQWIINGKDLKKFNNLRAGQKLKGPKMECNKFIFQPHIIRSATAFPNYTGFGITCLQNATIVHWSYLIEEKNYSIKEKYADFNRNTWSRFRSIKNEQIAHLSQITISIFIRPFIQ